MISKVKTFFVPGEEWVYYKVYCGISTIDYLLLNSIKPLIDKFLNEKTIKKWFYIRYNDSDNHLRLRLLLTNKINISCVIEEINKVIEPYMLTNQIWNLQLSTYKRELVRYGSTSMEISETFFFNDSENIIKLIEKSSDEKELFSLTFSYINSIIELFNFNEEILISFLFAMQKSFKKEFNVEKNTTKKSLSNKYREFEKNIIPIVRFVDLENLKVLIDEIIFLDKENKLEVSIEELLGSYIHMSLNRAFSNRQRLFEMIIYDFLYKNYKSKFARL